MNINKTKQSQDSFFYKLMAIVAIAALVVIIILIVPNATSTGTQPGGSQDPVGTGDAANTGDTTGSDGTTNVTDTTGPQDTASPDDTTATPDESSAADDTTDPSDTTKAPETDAPVSGGALSAVPTQSEMLSRYSGTMLGETADAGQDYINDIIFLGDSTTFGLKYYGVLEGGKDTLQVWTPRSGTITLDRVNSVKILYPNTEEEITIVEAVKLAKPKMMVITLGVNGVSFMDETQFKDAYTTLVKSIKDASPDTKIILQSIFPAAKSYDTTGGINNEKINAANVWIADIAKECSVKFLYTASALMGEDNYMVSTYHNGDGLHLCQQGFAVELEYIRTHTYN